MNELDDFTARHPRLASTMLIATVVTITGFVLLLFCFFAPSEFNDVYPLCLVIFKVSIGTMVVTGALILWAERLEHRWRIPKPILMIFTVLLVFALVYFEVR